MSNGNWSCSENHLRCWRWLSRHRGDAEWFCLLEDDAIPVTGFRDQLEQALEVAPRGIVSLYLGKLRPPQYQHMIQPAIDRAEDHEAHWLVSRQLLHAVGLAVRGDLLDDMLANLDDETPVDEGIGVWANKHFYRIAYVWPSLIDHADTETLIAHRDGQHREPGRVAWKTGTRDFWSYEYVEMN